MKGWAAGRQEQNLLCLLSTAPLAVRLGNEASGLPASMGVKASCSLILLIPAHIAGTLL